MLACGSSKMSEAERHQRLLDYVEYGSKELQRAVELEVIQLRVPTKGERELWCLRVGKEWVALECDPWSGAHISCPVEFATGQEELQMDNLMWRCRD